MRFKFYSLVLFWIVSLNAMSQEFIDSCFLSGSSGISFADGSGIANTGVESADMLTWSGSGWTGGWDHANLSAPAPPGKSGCDCKAVWMGNGTSWTSGGEGFALKLKEPIISGEEYSIDFTYISNGAYSDGEFSPFIYSTNSIQTTQMFFIDTLPDVGYSWATNTLTFIADTLQHGHTWINVQTVPGEGSGMVSAFCPECPCRGLIEMPNIFTPNGDGVNDLFTPVQFKYVTYFYLRVYNRWGQLMREDKQGIPDWNGKVDLDIVPDGVYYWIMEYNDIKDNKYAISGYLHLKK